MIHCYVKSLLWNVAQCGPLYEHVYIVSYTTDETAKLLPLQRGLGGEEGRLFCTVSLIIKGANL